MVKIVHGVCFGKIMAQIFFVEQVFWCCVVASAMSSAPQFGKNFVFCVNIVT